MPATTRIGQSLTAMTTAAVLITGAPGAGKTSVLDALTTLLENAGIHFGALETEQLTRGHPWLSDARGHAQLREVCRLQRSYGRELFLLAATTETDADLRSLLDAVAAERRLVVCLRASPATVRRRVLGREPEAWGGRDRLAAHAAALAGAIPALEGIDL